MSVNGENSNVKAVDIGVPQGSTLGPLLFIIYINDLNLVANHCRVVHFADDTTLYHSNSKFTDAVSNINDDLLRVQEWLQCNRLSVNVTKTNYMIITNKIIPDDCPVRFGNDILSPVDSAKFLGVTIDSKMSFTLHVQDVKSKIARGIGVMRKLAQILPLKTLRTLYFSLVHCHVMYALPVWGNSGKTNSEKISNMLNKAIVMLTHSDSTANTPNQFNLFNFEQNLKVSNLINFHKIVYNLNQQYFWCKLQRLQVVHTYPTTFQVNNNYLLPHFRISKCQNSFLYKAIKSWNELPSHIRNIESPVKFKKEIKKYITFT